MTATIWKRIYEINKIKATLKKLKERGLMFSEEKFIKEIMKDVNVSERTAKEYLKAAQDNPIESPPGRKFDEQSKL